MRLIRELREPFSAASHLSGALAGVFGAVYLLSECDQSIGSVMTILVYSFALIGLFLVSGLLHGLHGTSKMIERLERFDYAAIYLFIAGTYTPICLYVIGGWFGLELLIAEWVLAGVGASLVLMRGPQCRSVQVAIFLTMGWAFLLAIPSLSRSLEPMPFLLLVLGGLFYSAGALIFLFDWPSLFRQRYSAHDFWHLLVLLGSAAHFAAIAQVMTLT